MPIPGSVPIAGFIAPTDVSDTYATHDAFYGRDGLRSVGDAVARNAITVGRRRVGMMVFQEDTGQYWSLNASPWTYTDSDWTVLSFSGGGGSSFTDVGLVNATAVTVDSTLVDTYGEVTWKLVLWNTSGARETWTVEATHDGTLSGDATTATYSVTGKGPDGGHTIDVDLNGVGVAQVMRLRITANGTGWTAAWLRIDPAVAGAT